MSRGGNKGMTRSSRKRHTRGANEIVTLLVNTTPLRRWLYELQAEYGGGLREASVQEGVRKRVNPQLVPPDVNWALVTEMLNRALWRAVYESGFGARYV